MKCAKQCYKSQTLARKQLRFNKRRYDENMHIYYCKQCKAFHIGHDS